MGKGNKKMMYAKLELDTDMDMGLTIPGVLENFTSACIIISSDTIGGIVQKTIGIVDSIIIIPFTHKWMVSDYREALLDMRSSLMDGETSFAYGGNRTVRFTTRNVVCV